MANEKKYKVLLVDDEPDILELMEEEFRYAGYQTAVAECGKEAVEIIRQGGIDIVVSDYKMPNGNGMMVLEEINSYPEELRPTFFFVSGQADISAQEAINAGARKFFTKPFDLDDLIREVSTDAGVNLPIA